MTLTGSNFSGTTGVGLGYAYMDDNGVALKAGVATSGSESVVKVGVSWEFGGKRSTFSAKDFVPFADCRYVDGKLEYEQKCVPKE